MLPMIGPWCDSRHFTDADLLEKIGRLNRDTAVGTLANLNLTGDALARVAETANLILSNVEAFTGGAHLLVGRTADDQVTIVTAALARSDAAGRAIVEHLDPEAALTLYRSAIRTRFKGSGIVRTGVEEIVKGRSFLRKAHKPGFAELVEAVLPLEEDDLHPHAIVARAAASFGDPDALRLLAGPMATVVRRTRGRGDADLNTLLLLTYGHPDVVRHWAEHGGSLGRQVACLDHRQDGEWLTALAADHPDTGLEALLMLNPAVSYESRASRRGAEFAALLMTKDPRAAMRASSLATESKVLIEHGIAFDGVDVSTHAGISAGTDQIVDTILHARAWVNSLLRLELLLHGHLGPEQADEAARSLTSGHGLPGSMNALVLARFANRPLGNVVTREALRDLDPVRAAAHDPEGDPDPLISDFCRRYERPTGAPMRYPGAALVAEEIRDVADLERLFETVKAIRDSDTRAHGAEDTLSDALAESRRGTRADVSDAGIYDLIPDALGAL